MNLVILSGNICKDIELKTSGSGTAYISNSIAVKRKYHKDGEADTDFFTFTLFGKPAEAMAKHLSKGSRIILTGTLQNSSYTTKEGVKKEQTKVMASEWEFGDSNKKEDKASPNDFLSVPDGLIEQLPFS